MSGVRVPPRPPRFPRSATCDPLADQAIRIPSRVHPARFQGGRRPRLVEAVRSEVIAQLIHLNGAPGVGKSTVARRYLDDHPLALLLDIDTIRTALGRWREHEESMMVARDLALAMAHAHLRVGHDVVVPQYVGRPEFIEALGDVAERSGADFMEVLLEADPSVNLERFRSRRKALLNRGVVHPEGDVLDANVESAISDACANLARVAGDRPSVIRVRADGALDESYADLMEAIRMAAG